MKKEKSSVYYALFWLFLSTMLLTLPGSAFPRENWLDKIWFDKWVHAGMFFLLVWLWCRTVYAFNRLEKAMLQIFIIVSVVFVAYGIVMEWVQQNFIANRSFDNGDIIADIAGCVAGLLFSSRRYIKK